MCIMFNTHILHEGILLSTVKYGGKEKFILYRLHKELTKMQSHFKDLLDVDKQLMCSRQYDVPPPSDSGTWAQ